MAQIDSGLGWSCDENYYVFNAGTLIDYPNGNLNKANNGAAIIGYHHNQLGWYCLYIVSTIPENSYFSCENGSCKLYNNKGNLTIDGVTWYYSAMYNYNASYASDSSYVADYQYVFDSVDNTTDAEFITRLLTASNMTYVSNKDIPSIDYLHEYVEGVVKGNNERLKVGDVSSLKTTAKTDIVSAINELKGTIYTFHIDPDEADSYDSVTYHDDATGMAPASMGATTFNYGSWAAFINRICKPCMLKFDGTVDYYLDPNDYSKKLDGTASDVADLSYPGNAMVEFSLLWWKSWGDGWVSISDYQVDATYKCWSNLDADGNIIPYFYLPIYNGCIYDGKMRSISGIQLKSWSTTAYSSSATYAVGDEVNHNSRMWKCITAVETPEDFDVTKWEQFPFNANTTGEEEITYATANNTTTKVEWYTDVWCDRVLINALLVLIGKCIDTQGTFGRGIDSGGQTAKETYVTGSLNDKGLFYGDINGGSTASKIFGMENWLGCEWRRTAGLIGGADNTYLYKMTQSTIDGSTAEGYNTTGTGYLTASGRPASHDWLRKLQFGNFGFLPLEVGSYSTQYYKDHYWTGTGYAIVGGRSYGGSDCGAFCVGLDFAVGDRYWIVGAAPSCKPCLIKGAIINE